MTRALLLGVLLAAACSSDDSKPCDPTAGTGCDNGQVCERVTGDGAKCFAPLVLRGKVTSLADGAAVAGARVVALDVNGAPVSPVATSDAAGAYELAVPVERGADGTPVAESVTLRADAAGFVTFPSGIRQSLPIAVAGATAVEGKLVVMSALTNVGLIALPGAGTGSIAGKVDVAPGRTGLLVVAETNDGVGRTAIADTTGDYKIFNVAPGAWAVTAYTKGASYSPAAALVAAGQTATANVKLGTKATAKLSGGVSIVNAGGGTVTSVILVVESTFNQTLARGESPPGLRAANVSNAFTIEGVPEGRYVVLAAFENDLLVRDPDTGIGGTMIVHQAVTAGVDATIAGDFKVTGALAVIGPGADAPEAVTKAPTLTWVDDSSEEGYQVFVYDALGNQVWMKDLPRETGKNPTVVYDGPFAKGMYYQFRAVSLRSKGQAGLRPISATEDLRGVFYVPTSP
jgi:hypothetical protein